ncbi:N-acetylmuramoyl-L-alanine amidase [Paracoccus caeni]|uniref:N-acetylmuramoyl-L-alanine amidase n=1 Tax=Paracoccus caeni TaxID=657651 RepID=A0A934SAZ0_9RHOB|nr:N-acetylmuramoyl-L-alanine amidase [Paracoccus caeni]MBK4214403.1 N-acetylmuramoyl-L-alanine amidase [Paracoccus caeni]
MKVAIVVGHTKDAPGAYSPYFKEFEYHWNTDLANRIAAQPSSHEIKIFYRDNVGISGAYEKLSSWGAAVSIELHFNSSHNSTSTGTGVLYLSGNHKGKILAGVLQARLMQTLGLPDWPKGSGGVVTPFQASGKQERGKTSLSAGKPPAALVEPFFGSNPNDCKRATAQKDQLAQAYILAMSDYA